MYIAETKTTGSEHWLWNNKAGERQAAFRLLYQVQGRGQLSELQFMDDHFKIE